MLQRQYKQLSHPEHRNPQVQDLALPLIILLAGQVVLMFIFTYFVVFNIMGRDYDAAVLAAGTCGFGMGATPNAMANMQAICEKYAPSVKAYLLLQQEGCHPLF